MSAKKMAAKGVGVWSDLQHQRRLKKLRACLPPLVSCELLEQRMLLSVSATPLLNPLSVTGNTWTYLATGPGGSASITRTVIGPLTFNGHSAVETDITTAGFTAIQTQYNGYDAAGDYVQFGQGSINQTGTSTESYSPYRVGVVSSMSAGVTYESISTTDNTDGSTSTDTDDQQLTLVSESLTPLTVPAGTFKTYEEIDVETATHDNGIDPPTVNTSTTDIWYAPDVGIVQIQGSGVIESLSSYQVAGDHLDFTQQPTETDKGDTISPITISAKDSHGNVDPDATGSVTLALNSVTGDGKLTGTVTKALVDGEATFDDLQVDAGGTYTLTATTDATPSIASATSSEFEIDSSGLTWTGAGDGVNWSDPKNWDANVKPQDGDSLIFPDGSPLNPNNDMTGLTISSIDIQGSGYKLTGNAISLTDSLISEAGNNTYDIDTTLVGSPEIDDQTGDLDIKSVLSGDNITLGGSGEITFDDAGTYTGDTTLKAGVTIDDDVLTDAFGSGDITIGSGASAVTIDAGVGGGVATINNDITFQDGSTLATDPEVVLGGTVTVNGQDSLAPTGPDDQITINADNIEGSGSLLIKGGGKVSIKGKLIATVQVVVLAGELDFDGKLLGSVGGADQIVMKGGTVKAISLDGNGGIDLVSGTFIAGVASTAANYGGTITLEQSPTGKPGPTLSLGTGAGVGSGQIVVKGPVALTSNVPTIDASTAASGLTLDNTLVMKAGSIVNISGAVTFSQAVSMDDGATAEINTLAKTDSITFNGGISTSLTGVALLGLDGPGTVTLAGTVADGVSITYGAALTDSSGLLILSANLGGVLGTIAGGSDQVFLTGGKTRLVGVSGSGGIDVQSGTLLAGLASEYHGRVTLEQSASDKPTATIILGNATGLGDGILAIASTTTSDGNTPLIDASSATVAVSLDNELVLRDSAVVNIRGPVAFTQAVRATGSTGAINTVTSTDKLTLAGGITNNLTNSPTILLDGPGLITLGGGISLGVSLIFGKKLAGNDGELDLSTNLGGPLAQVTFSAGQLDIEGGKVRMTGLSGSGGIDLKGGALFAGVADDYEGAIQLFQTASGDPGVVVILQDSTTLGKGSLDIASPTTTGGSTPLIDASLATAGITLANALYLDDNSIVKITGNVTFTSAATAAGATAAINGVTSSDKITLQGGITSGLSNTPTVSLDGSGIFTIGGAISFPVTIDYGATLAGTTGQFILSADLGGSLSVGPVVNDKQVIVQGGTVTLSGVSHNGGIEVQAGTLVAGTVNGYSGTITLDAAAFGQTNPPSLRIGDNAGFGTGKLVIATPGVFAASTPLLDASSATSTVTIDNTLELQDGATLNVSGNVTFSQAVTVDGSTAAMNTTNSGDKLKLAGGIEIGSLITTTVSLDGPGTITLAGDIISAVTIQFGAKLAALSGLLDLSANLGGSVGQLFSAGQVVLLGGSAKLDGVSGTGGIDLKAGVLQVGDGTHYSGAITLYQGATSTTGPSIFLQNGDSLGGGTLGVVGGSGSGVPLIDASHASNGITLANALKLKDGAILNVTGTLTFSGQVTLGGQAAAEVNTLVSTDVLSFTGGIEATPLAITLATLGLDGPGTTQISGLVTEGMSIVYGTALTGTTGSLILSADLGGLLGTLTGGSDQVLVKGGTVQLSGLTDSGGIQMQGGKLVAGSADSYSGKITLKQSSIGQPGVVVNVGDNATLGTGILEIDGPPLLASNVPTIDASHATVPVTLANTLYMNTSSIVNITGDVTFTNAVKIAEGTTAEINTISNIDKLNLNGGITNAVVASSVLGLDGPGTTTIGGTIGAKLAIQYGASLTGSTGILVLACNIGGIVGEVVTTSSVVVQGGDVKLNGVSGSNGIELQGGTLEAGTASSFHGNITLDQGNGTLQTPKIIINSNTSLGDGELIVTGPTTSTTNVPLLDASGAFSPVTLANTLTLQDGTTLNILGSITFTEAVSAAGASAVNTTSTGDVVIFQGGITTGLTGTPTVTLDGPSTFGIGGTLSNPVSVVFGAATAGTTGTLVLGCSLGGILSIATPNLTQVTLKGGKLGFQGLSGNSGIDLQGGTLVAQNGVPAYTGTITLETGGTISVQETIDSVALGTGKLRLLGGTLVNNATATAILDNNVSVEGTVDVTSLAARMKFAGNVNILVTGELDAHGSVAVTGSITGPGIIKLDGSDFDVSGSNSGYTGNIDWDSGNVEVTSNSALGLGKVLINAVGKVILQAVNSIGDPILDNPFVVNSGTLVIEGQFTFPNGLTIEPGAIVEIEGAGTEVDVTGPLAGGGKVLLDGGTFSATGDESGFTGTISDLNGQSIPTLVITDAGGVANGSPFPATVTLTGTSGTPSDSLDGVSPSVLYYVGSTTTGTGSSTPPSAVGTYTVVATFAGSANYVGVSSAPVTFEITSQQQTKTTPTLTVTDAGGIANGSPFPATYTLIGTSGTPSDSLDGVTPTLTYYVGSTVSGPGSITPPSAVGAYTVVASFACSANYNSTDSEPVTFVISLPAKLLQPTITAPAKATVAENGSIAFSAADLISVADADANGTAEQLTLSARHGAIHLQSLAGLSVVSGSNGTGAITVSGTIADLNAALNGMTYTPAGNYSGSDSLKLSIKDHDGQTASTTVALTVQPIAPPPTKLIEPKVRMNVSSHTVVPGQKVTISLDSLDLKRFSPNKRLTYTVSFGDGTTQTFVGKFDASLTHVYQATGNYTISVTATDQTGHTGNVVSQQVSVLPAVVERNPFNPHKTALFIGGTPGNDVIVLKDAGRNKIAVTVNNIPQGTFSTIGPIFVERDGGHDVITADKKLRDRIFAV